MRTVSRNVRRACLVGVAVAFLSGCEGEFASDPLKPRPSRAVVSPVEQNSASGEMSRGDTTGVPILSVEFPNTKEEKPKIHTITDDLVPHPATQPAAPATASDETAPRQITPAATQRPSTRPVDPIYGPP
jgi:hypothetical protein